MGGFSYGDSSYDSATKINSNSIQVSDKVYSNSAPHEYHHRKDNEQDWDYVDFDDMEGRNTQTKLDEMLKSSMSGLMDFNNDGKLDSKDVDLFNAKLSSNSLDSTFTYSKDLNGDGKVDSLDVNILDNYINGEDISQFVDISNLNYINNLLQSDYAKEHPNSISELLNTNGYDNISDEANLKVYADRYMKSVADFNGDGKIDKNDISYLTDHLGSNSSDYSFNSKADFNGDGIFDEKDIDIYKKYQAGEDVSKLIGNNQVLADAYKDDLMNYQRKRDQYIKYKEYLEAHDGSKDDIKELEKKIADLNNQMRNVKRNYQALGRNTDSTYVKPTDKSSTYWDDKIDYDKIYQCYVDGQGFTNYENWIKDEYKDAVKDEYGGLSSYPFDFLSVIEYLADEKGLGDDALDDIARMGWSDTVNEYRNYTKDQKANYHKAMREGGRDAAEDYYNSEYDEMWGRKDYYEFLSNKYGKDYADMVFSNDDIVLYFKMESQKDYTFSINKKSESDYIKDFLKSTNNQSLLDRYLKGEDIMSEIDSYKYLEYKYNEQLKEYEDKRAALQFKMEELKELYKYLPDDEGNESGDINDIHMSKQEVDGMLDELSEEIAKYNQLIKSQKSTVEQLPYMNIMCTDEYQDYVKNFDPAWQDEVDYEKLYNQMKNSKNVNGDSLNWAKEEYVEASRNNGSTIDLANTQVDWIAVVEYMINVKGYNFDENDNGWTGISDSYTYYKHMTSEQLYMYHYLFKTKGYDAAKEYLDVIADDINKAKGKEEALEWIQSLNPSYEYDENGNIIAIHVDDNAMNTIRQFLGGVETGMTDYYSGMLKWGQDGYTVDEYKQMYVMKILGDSDLLVGAFNAGRVTGSIETAAAITTFCTIVCPEGVGGHVALAFNNIVGVANAGGNAQHSVLVEGYSEATANEYAKQIMQNTLLTNLSSSAIGYGIGSTLQYSSLLNGTNNLGFLNNLAISGANGIIGAGTAVWSKAEEQKLQESLLSKRFEVDDKNGELLQSFMDSMLMTALSTGKTMAFELVLGGESLHFSTDDWIDYLKSDDSPTAEDFVRNAYSGSKTINPYTGDSYDVPKGMSQEEYSSEAVRIIADNSNRELTNVEKNNLKYIFNQMDDENITKTLDSMSGSDLVKALNYLNSTGDKNLINSIINTSKSNTKYMTTLTTTLLKPTLDYYENASSIAGDLSAFKTYRSHTEDHVQEVAQKTMESVNSIKAALDNNPVEGFSSNVNSYECYVAALWHDVGMAAGTEGMLSYDSTYENGKIVTKPLVETKNGGVTRSNHSFNSAMNVLANSEQISALGVDPNNVALLAFAHSKSNSGVSVVNNAADWSLCIDKINSAVNYHNEHNPNNPIVFSNTGGTNFIESLVASGILDDASTTGSTKAIYKNGVKVDEITYNGYNINPDKLGELASGTYALRLGDANTNNNNIGTNQAGQKIDMSSLQRNGTTSFDTSAGFGDINKLVDSEAAGSTIKIGSETVTLDTYGAGYVLGESNIDFSTDVSTGGSLVEKFTVLDPTDYPACTAFNIDERLGEVATADKGKFKTKIEICLSSKDVPAASKPQIEAYYKAFAESRGIDPANVVWV